MNTRRSSHPLAANVRKLARIATELQQGESFSITRLTMLKRLCADPGAAARFALHLTERTHERMQQSTLPSHLTPERWESFKQQVAAGVECLSHHLSQPTPETLSALRVARSALKASQNQYQKQAWGPVRIIESREALLVEVAISCVLMPQQSADWGYRLARNYAERYAPRYGSGLIPDSAPYVEEIAAFWRHELGA
jgi:hypothetical protein